MSNKEDIEVMEEEVEEEIKEEETVEAEETSTKKNKPKKEEKVSWKVSNSQFNEYTEEAIAKPIKKYLDELAQIDPTFAKGYADPSRNFDECMIFVINRAFSKRESSDEICYRNAREYYMGEIKPEEYKKKLYDNVSMPQKKVELTDEEKKELKAKAIKEATEQFKQEKLRKLKEAEEKAEAKAKEEEAKRKEAEKAKREAEKAAKEEAIKQGAFEQISLFDM